MNSVPTSMTRTLGAVLLIGTAALVACVSPVNPNQQDDKDDGPNDPDQTGMIVPAPTQAEPLEPTPSLDFGDDLA